MNNLLLHAGRPTAPQLRGWLITLIVVVGALVLAGRSGPGRKESGTATGSTTSVFTPALQKPAAAEPVEDRVQSSSPEPVHLVARNPIWYELTYPSTWYLDAWDEKGAVSLEIRSYAEEEWPTKPRRDENWAVLNIYTLMTGSVDSFHKGMPEGCEVASTSTVEVDGQLATRTDEHCPGQVSPSGHTDRMFDIRFTTYGVGQVIEGMSRADSETAHQRHDTIMGDIISSLHFIPNYLKDSDGGSWTETVYSLPAGPVGAYRLSHKTSWTLTQLPSPPDELLVEVSGPELSAGPFGLHLTPKGSREQSGWTSGRELPLLLSYLLFGHHAQLQSEGQVVSGWRVSEYLIDLAQHDVVGLRISTPVLPPGSPDYWLYEQAAWVMAHQSGVSPAESYTPVAPYP